MQLISRRLRLEGRGARLALMAAVVSGVFLLWGGFATFVVPAIIESAYRGESVPAINAIVDGRRAHPVEHYVEVWNELARQLTLAGFGYGLLGLLVVAIASHPTFFRKYVGDSTPGTLGAIRMLTCAVVLVTTSWEDLASVALLPAEMRQATGAMAGVYSLPGFERMLTSAVALDTLQWVTELLLFLGAIGLLTRLVIPLSALAHFVVLGILIDYSFFWHQNLVPLYLLVVLSFTPCGDGWSVDRLWKLARGRTVPEGPSAVYGWSRYLCWLVIVLPYVQAGLSKVRMGGLSWWDPTNMRAMLYVDNLDPREYAWNLSRHLVSVPDSVFMFLGITTVFLEVSYFLVLFSRKARWLLPTMMVMVHAGIFLLQRILFFDLMLLQLAFLDFAAARQAIARRLAERRWQVEVLYDGSCHLCLRTVGLLRAFDLFSALRFVDFTRLDLAAYNERRALDLEVPHLEESMHVVSRGRVFRGFAAYRVLAAALPLFWPLTPWLVVPGIARIGDSLYNRVARNRTRHGTCDATCRPAKLDERSQSLAAAVRPPAARFRYALAASALVSTSVVCWIHRVEFYPLTAWHLYAMLDTSGTVSYTKTLAHYESGMTAPVRLEEGIGALALDGRYTPMLGRCFGDHADVALCQKFLTATGYVYNARRPPGSRLTHFEIQAWSWDFLSSPLHPEQGQLRNRVIIEVSSAADGNQEGEPVEHSSQR